ncbi:two-component system response regulator BtsR [Shewanella sp. D64]|uniref:two-component system response regulator BtsR n=1 Tax=unclassified Shewanella TaxID=196818 RepID=UPI0022BA3AF3|nr:MULTISPECIES: two-component system response regulator BtsR [unclassified Shewanella]MEC4725967.1 two-component system response regulator BtsR [Shewanella sp. D64]MEC4737222.1 two-component system response regulator BtsR [Shewanella sp. E94]WBJ93601.1 two-component system response regulator BtsR [Shewanella sp. MTB7]
MITSIIVDDELFAREELVDLLSEHADIEIIGQCSNAIEALQMITKLKPQLVFLDIQMPRITGMELIGMLDPDTMPSIVFVTAFDEFAIKAFDNHAFDYLLKPIDEMRLAQTLTKLRKNISPKPVSILAPAQLTHLPCYTGTKLKVLALSEVEYIFSDLSGIHVATNKELVHTHLTLKVLEEKTSLVRCHRQYLIKPDAVSEIEVQETGAEVTTVSGAKVPVSRRYLKPLKQLFGFQ